MERPYTMTLSSISPLAVALCGIIILVIRYIHSRGNWRARSKGRPFPPGPQSLPVVGNLLDIPKVRPWEAYRDMSTRYGAWILCWSETHSTQCITASGDILFFRMLGQSLMVLGSAKVAFELLEKRSVNYSDRPQSPMFDLYVSAAMYT